VQQTPPSEQFDSTSFCKGFKIGMSTAFLIGLLRKGRINFVYPLVPSKLAQVEKLLPCIGQVPASNHGQGSGFSERFFLVFLSHM
jgi:hypothetical protein